MKAYSTTHVGRVRNQNEDSVLALENSQRDIITAVADGMGGHENGEIASSLIIEKLNSTFASVKSEVDIKEYKNLIESSLQEVNKSIRENSQQISGMGSTIVTAVANKDKILVANVGDSSAFIIKSTGEIKKLSKDHTTVQRMVDIGKLNESEARVHPDRHVLYQAVGREIYLDIYYETHDITENDKYLFLCSDGLTDYINIDEISTSMLQKGYSIEEKIKVLVQYAIDLGGKDNISIVIIDLEEN